MNVLPFKQPKICFVLCRNADGWHTDTPFVAYFIWNGKILDEPDAATCIRIVRKYEGKRKVEIIERPCRYCQKRLGHRSP